MRGALTGWPLARHQLAAIHTEEKIPPTVQSLVPRQLEVLCDEYLRHQKLLSALLLPIGGTLIGIDILGLNDNGETVVAQVTHSTNSNTITEKLKNLRAYRTKNPTTYFFFGPKSCTIKDDPVVKYISIEHVFHTFHDEGTSRVYKDMLNKMLGYALQD